jgi:presenilin-like A22 family membrane protease
MVKTLVGIGHRRRRGRSLERKRETVFFLGLGDAWFPLVLWLSNLFRLISTMFGIVVATYLQFGSLF